jgi:MFS family permease
MDSQLGNSDLYKNLKHNILVNVMDGGFFGLALGFASFSTIIPLFVSQMTSSALLIGLIPGLHVIGWQLPQLLTAKRIAAMNRYKPYVVFMTIQERLPFLGLAIVSGLLPAIGNRPALLLTFLILTWQGIGGGLTANAWQNLIGKVIPSEYRGTFFGLQSAASNLLSSIGAIGAGAILERLPNPVNYTICFLAATGMMFISWFFLRATRESKHVVEIAAITHEPLWNSITKILKRDRNFFWFLLSRMLSQFGLMAFAFYTVFAVRYLGMSNFMAGVMTSILLITQVSANPLLGWLADHSNRKSILEMGSIATALSALLAIISPNVYWFILVFILAGLANTAFWTIGIALSLEFGPENERPTYIGMANTLIAPSALLAPMLGGWLADFSGFTSTFILAALSAIITALIYHFLVIDPKKQTGIKPVPLSQK